MVQAPGGGDAGLDGVAGDRGDADVVLVGDGLKALAEVRADVDGQLVSLSRAVRRRRILTGAFPSRIMLPSAVTYCPRQTVTQESADVVDSTRGADAR